MKVRRRIQTRRRRGGITPLLPLLFSAALGQGGITLPNLIAKYGERTYDPGNPSETCYEILYVTDANGDGVVQNHEYVSFVRDLSEGDFGEVPGYVDLPFVLKVNFVYLSCLCGRVPGSQGAIGGGDGVGAGGCCEGPQGGIFAPSSTNATRLPLWEEDYLRTVCSETQGAIDYAREEMGITASPTEPPTKGLTEVPTMGPIMGPTMGPTKGPTKGPTDSPTDLPTNPPTDPITDPTIDPLTDLPTILPPTLEPTLTPTLAKPIVSPTTSHITDDPTKQPNLAPVIDSSTAKPTTMASTLLPTTVPTTDGLTASPILRPTTMAPMLQPTFALVTDGPTVKATTSAPSLSSNTQSPSPPPTSVRATDALGTLTPTSTSLTTKAPTTGTRAPSTKFPTKAPINRVGALTHVPTMGAPTMKPSSIKFPTALAPTIGLNPKLQTPGGTQYPSVYAQVSPSQGAVVTPPTEFIPTTLPPWYISETPFRAPPSLTDGPDGSNMTNLPSDNHGSVHNPGGGANRVDQDGNDSESFSTGEVVGIILASCFVAYSAAYLYHSRRKRNAEDPELHDVRNKDLDDLEAGNAAELPTDALADGPGGAGSAGGATAARVTVASDAAVFGRERGTVDSNAAVFGDEKCSSGESDTAKYEGEPYERPEYIPRRPPPTSPPDSPLGDTDELVVSGILASPTRRPKGSDSSSAGESGWSSSAGMSSLNTASFDAGMDDGLLPGSPDGLLVAANVAINMVNSMQRDTAPSFLPVDQSSSGSYDSVTDAAGAASIKTPLQIHSGSVGTSPSAARAGGGRVTREDLNAAIEAGDWAMVGATAALLADSATGGEHNSLSGSEAVSRSIVSRESSRSFLSESSISEQRTRELDRMVERGDWEGVVLAAAQFEGNRLREEEMLDYSSRSEQTDTSKRMMGIRQEVEMLVRRVVPDEVDNIDEMLLQFEGREEELIETLRTMQERSVAQRARAAVQKTAKLEARSRASGRSLGGSGSGSMSSEPEFYANDSIASSSISDLGTTSDDRSDRGAYRSSRSDMSHSDLSRSSTSQPTDQSSLELAIERGDWRAVGEAAAMMGDGDHAGGIPNNSDHSLTDSLSGPRERATHIDTLIAKGDWAGIVATAGRYQAMDDRSEGTGSMRGEGGTPTEEEREALAQAKMWSSIAQKSKQGGMTEAGGAADAADWAISRSLEQQMRGGAGDLTVAAGRDPDPKKPHIADDESV